MGKIYIVRHGQDTDNVLGVLNGHRDTELSELGKAQAEKTAEVLAGKNISVIFSSPLSRARETAHRIKHRMGNVPIIIDRMLIERDFGELTGKLVADIPKLATKTVHVRKFHFALEGPGIETFEQARARAKEFLKIMKWLYSWQNIAIVTHGDMAQMFFAEYNNLSVMDALNLPYLGNAEFFELG